MDVALLVIRLGLAAVFGVAAVAKLTDRAGFRRALGEFGAPAALVTPLAVAVPAAEFAVAVGLVLPGVAWWAAAAAALLLGGFMVVIGRSLARGKAPDCNCFGRLSSGSVGRKTLVRNGVFAAAAGVVLVAGPARAEPGALEWVAGLTAAQQIGLGAGVLVGCLLASQGWLLVQLMRQNGRLLERLVRVEHSLNLAPWQRDQLPLLQGGHGANGHHHGHGHQHDAGLPVGTEAPGVRLPDLDGTEVDLADFRGTPTVLLFWSPTCGYCQQMLPDLKTWDADRPTGAPRLLVVSTGSAEDNRAMGLTAPVLLDGDFAVGGAYGSTGTPQAVLVNPDGTIATPLAAGGPAVLRLLATQPSPA